MQFGRDMLDNGVRDIGDKVDNHDMPARAVYFEMRSWVMSRPMAAKASDRSPPLPAR